MRGAFGHIPGGGSGANLTSMIRALRDQQTAAQDKAIFDAYQNGGTYNGKPVTDAIILAYISGRQAMYSKDDPLYSQWGDTLFQTRFSIGEQKIQLAYKQGKASAGAVADFYKQQLKSIPADSQFGRTVADHAAQWAKAAGGAARAGATARVKSAFEATLAPQFAAMNKYDAIAAYVKDAAVRQGLLTDSQSLTDTENAAGLKALIDSMSTDPNVTKFLGGTPLNFAEFQSLAQAKLSAMNTVIYKSTKVGTKVVSASHLSSLEKQRTDYVTQLHQTNAISPRSAYETLNAAFEQDMARIQQSGDPYAQLARVQQYATALGALAKNAEASGYGAAEVDPAFIGGLNNEINALFGKNTGPTARDIFNGSKQGGTGETYAQALVDAAQGKGATATSKGTLGYLTAVEMVTQGKGYIGQSKPGGALIVQPYTPGSENLPNHGLGIDTATMYTAGPNGVPIAVVLTGQPVDKNPTYTDINGNPVTNPTPEQIASGQVISSSPAKGTTGTVGYQYTTPDGNTIWAVLQPDGSKVFTEQNPFGQLSTLNGSSDSTSGLYASSLPPNPQAVPGGTHLLAAGDVSLPALLVMANHGIITDPATINDIAMQNAQNTQDHFQTPPHDNSIIKGTPNPEDYAGNNSNPTIKLPNLGAPGANGSFGGAYANPAYQTPSGAPPSISTPGVPGLSSTYSPPGAMVQGGTIPKVPNTYVAPPANAGNPNASPAPTTSYPTPNNNPPPDLSSKGLAGGKAL